MRNTMQRFLRWLPSISMMVLIFALSSIAGPELPQLGRLDFIARKAAHMLGYGLLAVSFWYAFGWRTNRQVLAWLLAVLYALTDEVHQAFIPGRHPWWADVLIFDALGAIIGLWLASRIQARHSRPSA